MKLSSTYMSDVHNPKKFNRLVLDCLACVQRLRVSHPFDAIAFRGTSGAAMAFPLSYITGIPLIHVRKTEVSSHSQARLKVITR